MSSYPIKINTYDRGRGKMIAKTKQYHAISQDASIHRIPLHLQKEAEDIFNMDFSKVKLHLNSEEPGKINAIAFACDNNIYFSPGSDDFNSKQGCELLFHELTHVVQQRQNRVATINNSKVKDDKTSKKNEHDEIIINSDPTLELEAQKIGFLIAHYPEYINAVKEYLGLFSLVKNTIKASQQKIIQRAIILDSKLFADPQLKKLWNAYYNAEKKLGGNSILAWLETPNCPADLTVVLAPYKKDSHLGATSIEGIANERRLITVKISFATPEKSQNTIPDRTLADFLQTLNHEIQLHVRPYKQFIDIPVPGLQNAVHKTGRTRPLDTNFQHNTLANGEALEFNQIHIDLKKMFPDLSKELDDVLESDKISCKLLSAPKDVIVDIGEATQDEFETLEEMDDEGISFGSDDEAQDNVMAEAARLNSIHVGFKANSFSGFDQELNPSLKGKQQDFLNTANAGAVPTTDSVKPMVKGEDAKISKEAAKIAEQNAARRAAEQARLAERNAAKRTGKAKSNEAPNQGFNPAHGHGAASATYESMHRSAAADSDSATDKLTKPKVNPIPLMSLYHLHDHDIDDVTNPAPPANAVGLLASAPAAAAPDPAVIKPTPGTDPKDKPKL